MNCLICEKEISSWKFYALGGLCEKCYESYSDEEIYQLIIDKRENERIS